MRQACLRCAATEKAGMSLFKFALFFFLVYVFFKLLKRLFPKRGSESRQQTKKPSFNPGPRQVNEMVQDPVCKVYVPKKEALRLDKAGKSYYFCCRSCMDRFQEHKG
jgi:YHS domain-containing protein